MSYINNPGSGGGGGPFQPLDADLTAIAALSGTGIACRTGAGTWALRTVVDAGSSRISVTNPGGVAGNITLDVNESALSLANLGSRSHGDLQNLLADDHTQYLLLAGRSGGQTVFGSPGAGEGLTFNSNPFNDGLIIFGSPAMLLLNEAAGLLGSFGTWVSAGDVIFQTPNFSINGLDYVWPASTAATTFLQNDGSNNLSWVSLSGTFQPLDADLTALAGLTTTGIIVRTGSGTATTRSIAVTDTSSIDFSISNADGVSGNPTVTGTVLPAGVDHNSLANLITGDPHTQYTLRAGRAGTANDTILSTTGNGTLQGSTATDGQLILLAGAHSTTLARIVAIPNMGSLGPTLGLGMNIGNQVAFNNANSIFNVMTVSEHGTWLVQANLISSLTVGGRAFVFAADVINDADRTDIGFYGALLAAQTIRSVTGTTVSGGRLGGLLDASQIPTTNAGTTVVTEATTVTSGHGINPGAGSATITTRRGFWYQNRAGTGTQTTSVGLDIDDQTVGTLAAGMRSAMTTGTGKWHLYLTGTAPSLFGGIITGSESADGTLRIQGTTNTDPGAVKLGAAAIAIAEAEISVLHDSAYTHNAAATMAFLKDASTHDLTQTFGPNYRSLELSPAFTQSANLSAAGFLNTILAQPTQVVSISSGAALLYRGLNLQPTTTIANVTATSEAASTNAGVLYLPTIASTTAGVWTKGADHGLYYSPTITTNNASGAITLTDAYAVRFAAPSLSGAGGETITNATALRVDDIAVTGVTNAYSVRSVGAAVVMQHAGAAVFAADAAPTNASVGLEVQSTTKAFLQSRMTRAQRNTLAGVAVADGMLLYDSTVNSTTARHNGNWVEQPGWDICISKGADQTVTNNSTLQDDTDLQFTVATGEVWHFELLLSISANNTTGDGKFQLLATAAVITNSWRSGVHFDSAGALVTGLFTPAAFTSTTEMVTSGGLTVVNGDGNTFPIYFRGTFRASGAATVKVQFANVSAASGRTTTMKAGSILRAKRMAA